MLFYLHVEKQRRDYSRRPKKKTTSKYHGYYCSCKIIIIMIVALRLCPIAVELCNSMCRRPYVIINEFIQWQFRMHAHYSLFRLQHTLAIIEVCVCSKCLCVKMSIGDSTEQKKGRQHKPVPTDMYLIFPILVFVLFYFFRVRLDAIFGTVCVLSVNTTTIWHIMNFSWT